MWVWVGDDNVVGEVILVMIDVVLTSESSSSSDRFFEVRVGVGGIFLKPADVYWLQGLSFQDPYP